VGLALATAVGVLAVLAGLRKIRAPDYWWQLSAGEWIAAHGRVPDVDVFTYTVPGERWLDVHWLFQLFLSGIHRLGGHDAVVLAKALCVLALVAILATIGWRRDRPWVSALGLSLVVLAANERFLARPELTSFVLLAAILALLERDLRRRDGWLWAVLPLQLLWVNSHGLFALGVVACAIYTLGEAIRCATGRGQSVRLRRLGLLTALVLLAAFVSPSFVDGALYPLEQLGMIAPHGSTNDPRFAVGEILPLWLPGLSLRPYGVALALASLGAIALCASWRRDSAREEHALMFAAFAVLFGLAVRNASLFAIVAGPLAILGANLWLDRHRPSRALNLAASGAVLLAVVLASVDLGRGRFYERIGSYHEPGLGYVELFAVTGAADWIERERPPGPIAHSMGAGGYLNWRLFPDYRVMVDGRLEVYGPSRMAELALTGPPAFRRLDGKYRFGVVVLSATLDSKDLIAWLYGDPAWKLVHLDSVSLVFVRAETEEASRWPEVDVTDPSHLAGDRPHLSVVARAHAAVRWRLRSALGIEPPPD